MRLPAAVILAAMAISTAVISHAQQERSIPPGKGVIAGRVIDAVSKRPVSGAMVRLWPRGMYDGPKVTTGNTGEFQFSSLGSFEYELTAERGGYVEGAVGKTWARGSRAPVLLEQDQTLTGLEILMWPMGELTGKVVDERGVPVAGVQVRAINQETSEESQESSRHLGSGSTDQHGEYRFAVQSPGRAILCVDAYYSSYAIPALAPNQRRVTDAPAIGEFSRPPSMLISADGRYLVTFSLLPPPATANGESQAYVSTCAPSSTSSSEAAVVEFKSGSTVVPDLILQPRRSIRISGRLLGPSGALGQTWLRLAYADEDRTFAFLPAQALTAIDGTFSFLIVPPGSYRWEVSVPNPPPTVTPSVSGFPSLYSPDYGTTDTNGYWIADPLEAGGGDITDLTLMATRGVTVSGTVIFDGAPAPKGERRPSVSLKTAREIYGGRMGEVTEGGKFEIQGVKPGRYGLDAYAQDFSIVEMTSGANDLIDGPLIVGEEGVTGVVVRMSAQPASISGVVRTTSNAIVYSPTVVIFPGDSRAWKTYGRQLRIRSIRGVAGRYEFKGLPPGDYHVAAIDDALMARWLNPSLFASLERTAQRVALQAGEQLTINLVKR